MRTKQKHGKGKDSSRNVVNENGVWKFYRWAAAIFPLLLMLSHWCVFYVFSQNTQELMKYSRQNEICIAWIYVFLFLILPLMTLPASFLYDWCNFFRIPFVYFIFINVERLYYNSWFCTNKMVNTHYILIYCIICIYVMNVIGACVRHRNDLGVYIKKALTCVTRVFGKPFRKREKDNELYNELMVKMEGKK